MTGISMKCEERILNIGEAAAQAGVPPKTIRYYESIGLVRPAMRAANGYRAYGEREIQTLRFVSRARSLGFSVKDVANLLMLYDDKGRKSSEVKRLAMRHVSGIDRKIAELTAMRATLMDLTEKCHGDNRPDCPILSDLAARPARKTREGRH